MQNDYVNVPMGGCLGVAGLSAKQAGLANAFPPPVPKEINISDCLKAAISRLADINYRAESIADTITGPRPANGQTQPPQAECVMQFLDELACQISRLDNSLQLIGVKVGGK